MSLESGRRKVKLLRNVKSRVAGLLASEENIFSKEKLLRGFQKKPIVLLERCDISPYLNSNRVVHKQNADSVADGFKTIDVDLEKLALQCTVVLIREDLEKLKRDICKKYNGDNTIKSKVVSKDSQTECNTALKNDKTSDTSSIVNKDKKRPQKRHKSHNIKASHNSQLTNDDGPLTTASKYKGGTCLSSNTSDTDETVSVNDNIHMLNGFRQDDMPITTTQTLYMNPMLHSILDPSEANGSNLQEPYDITREFIQRVDYANPPKKPIVDPISKKTIISRHNCGLCGKYYSSNYALTRHKAVVHNVNVNRGLQCKVCEETFMWPTLLETHRCIRAHIPEMPFDDARPEIMVDNMEDMDALDGEEDSMLDFDMPAPIVELTEYNQFIETEPTAQQYNINNMMCIMAMSDTNYNFVVQEVPIEF